MKDRGRAADRPQLGPSSARRQGVPGKRTLTERLAPGRDAAAADRRRRLDPLGAQRAPERAADWESSPDLMKALGLFSFDQDALRGDQGDAHDDSRPEARYQGPQPAPTYFAVHRAKILQAIGARLTDSSLPAPHARLKWATSGAGLASAFESALLDAESGVFNLAGKIPALLHPADPWALIDAHRELAPDNNNSMFGDLIAKFYMTNRNELASKASPYRPPTWKDGRWKNE